MKMQVHMQWGIVARIDAVHGIKNIHAWDGGDVMKQ